MLLGNYFAAYVQVPEEFPVTALTSHFDFTSSSVSCNNGNAWLADPKDEDTVQVQLQSLRLAQELKTIIKPAVNTKSIFFIKFK